MEPEQENARKEQAPKKAFKLKMSHIQGFVAGVLITAIIALGLWAGFGDSGFFSGTMDGTSLQAELERDYAAANDRLRAGVIARLMAALKAAERTKGSALAADEVRGVINREISSRQAVLPDYTNSGRTDLAQQMREEIVILQEYLDRAPAPTGPTPTTYVIFPADTEAGGSASEIRLFGFNRELEGFQPAPNIALQDASGKPLYYQSSESKSAEPSAEATVSGGMKYFANQGLPKVNMVGEVRLIKGLDTTANPGYIPCDGRRISINSAPALYSLLGTSFGGNGVSYFQVPDLPNSPVPGASYYILNSGDFPRSK